MMNHMSEVLAKRYRLIMVQLAELSRQRKTERRDSSKNVELLDQLHSHFLSWVHNRGRLPMRPRKSSGNLEAGAEAYRIHDASVICTSYGTVRDV